MILVVGATGNLGGNITRRLLAQGKDVRILVRQNSPSEQLAKQGMATSRQSLIDAGAKPVYGDLKDRASLDEAVHGVDTVITTANSALRGGEDNPQTIELEGNRNLVEAAKAAGVKHFVFVSVLGADPNNPMPFMQGKGQTEEHLQTSGMDFTIVKPNAYMDVWVSTVVGGKVMAGQPVTLVGEGRKRHSFILSDDVASFVVAALDNPVARNQTLVLGGPEAISWRDVVGTFERVLGRKVEVKSVPPGQQVPGLPDGMQSMVANFENYESVIPMEDTARAFGVNQTTVEAFVQRAFAGQKPG